MEKVSEPNDEVDNSPQLPIKYLLMGDVSTKKIITEFSSINNSSKIKKEINQIFSKICRNQSKKYNERNKISSKDSTYYFLLTYPNLLFIILVDDNYSENQVFELIEKINEEKVPTMINEETKELNPNGKKELKNIIDFYQKKNEEESNIKNENKINNDNNENNESKDDSENSEKIEKININQEIQSNSTEPPEDLQIKNDIFLMTDNKMDIVKHKYLYNYKMWIFCSIFIFIILLIVILF